MQREYWVKGNALLHRAVEEVRFVLVENYQDWKEFSREGGDDRERSDSKNERATAKKGGGRTMAELF